MAMVNMNNLLNGKDSRWLQLEVCREFQRNKCSRPDTECKFAHPPANVEVQNGRVTACYDSIKGRCNREKPPCKYFHPPQHLKDQLLINGRNHLALKNALMQQMGLSPGQPLVPGQVQAVAANPYLTGMPQVGSTYNPYFAPGPIMPTIMGPDPTGVGSPLGVVPQTVVAQQKMPRSDRLEPAAVSPLLAPPQAAAALEIGKKRPREPSTADTDLLLMDMKSVGSFYYDNFAFPGMMPYKRPAADKSGVPVYQPNATTYQQLMQLQQPFVPVSCEYSVSPSPVPSSVVATSCASSAVIKQEQSPQHQQQNPQSTTVQSNQISNKDNEIIPSTTTTVTNTITTTTPSPAPIQQQQYITQSQQLNNNNNTIHDPAALAKEVAQHNYAKAVKLAAVSQSLAMNHQLNQLNPLNYTGVALNKQALNVPPPAAAAAAAALARYPATAAFPYSLGTTGLSLGLANPYMAQQNFLNMTRPPPTAILNPYSLIRTPYPTVSTASLLGNSLLGTSAHQYPVTVSAAPMSNHNVSATANIAAAAAQNNNNVVMQPYKKLKTT